jgi:hypothetical protein
MSLSVHFPFKQAFYSYPVVSSASNHHTGGVAV